MSDTLESLQRLMAEKSGIPLAELDSRKPLEAFEMDSLCFAEWLFSVEDHFAIQLPVLQPGQLQDLAALAELVDDVMIKRLRNLLKNTRYSFAGQRLDHIARTGRLVLPALTPPTPIKQAEPAAPSASQDLSFMLSV